MDESYATATKAADMIGRCWRSFCVRDMVTKNRRCSNLEVSKISIVLQMGNAANPYVKIAVDDRYGSRIASARTSSASGELAVLWTEMMSIQNVPRLPLVVSVEIYDNAWCEQRLVAKRRIRLIEQQGVRHGTAPVIDSSDSTDQVAFSFEYMMTKRGSKDDIIRRVRRGASHDSSVSLILLTGPSSPFQTRFATCLADSLDATVLPMDDLIRCELHRCRNACTWACQPCTMACMLMGPKDATDTRGDDMEMTSCVDQCAPLYPHAIAWLHLAQAPAAVAAT